ncbi:MAG TPA: Xaa-Pro aminopeptidase [Candidatus Fermentibacter daniensis]|nr:Xaa-Pro aminopeptidase [Candidatus Fermentibacter daniensis]HOR08206.1 Xaa-Pro aminopeptidase [Candidatus Fermentibacter daniensis]HPK52641.1 Xaa-Pro aminopeptidase [Candidatus Fermentibacter daniensis]
MFSAQDYSARRAALLDRLPERSLAVIPPTSVKPSSADASHTYAPSRNLFYLTGLTQENTWLLLFRTPAGDTVETLFTDPFDPEYEKWWGRKLTAEEASTVSGIATVRTDRDWEGAIDRSLMRGGIEHVFVDYPVAGLGQPRGQRQRFAWKLSKAWPDRTHGRLSPHIHAMRMVKDEKEAELIRKAAGITGEAFAAALSILRPGIRECVIEAELQRVFIASGAREAFPVIAAGGARATCLHYTSNDAVLEDGDLLLIDFGAAWKLYCSDITRTVPVNGRYTDRQRQLVEMVLETQRDAIHRLSPGKLHAAWNLEVSEAYAERLAAAGIIHEPAGIDAVYYHRTGHHLGLDTHDEALAETPIAPGMVFTVEPGLYVAAESIGIRIEDDVMVGGEGNTILSDMIPREPSDIEALMARGRG